MLLRFGRAQEISLIFLGNERMSHVQNLVRRFADFGLNQLSYRSDVNSDQAEFRVQICNIKQIPLIFALIHRSHPAEVNSLLKVIQIAVDRYPVWLTDGSNASAGSRFISNSRSTLTWVGNALLKKPGKTRWVSRSVGIRTSGDRAVEIETFYLNPLNENLDASPSGESMSARLGLSFSIESGFTQIRAHLIGDREDLMNEQSAVGGTLDRLRDLLQSLGYKAEVLSVDTTRFGIIESPFQLFSSATEALPIHNIIDIVSEQTTDHLVPWLILDYFGSEFENIRSLLSQYVTLIDQPPGFKGDRKEQLPNGMIPILSHASPPLVNEGKDEDVDDDGEVAVNVRRNSGYLDLN